MSLPKTTLALAALTGALLTGVAAPADRPSERAKQAGLRVGTYDSRAVTVAFAASKIFDRQLQHLMQERQKAKAAGDEEKIKQLESKGEGRQKQFHRQGFGTAPVDDILENIKDELPGIAKQADVIVSKWAITYSTPGTEFVDVTDLIVAPFEPGERTKRYIRELRSRPPAPPEEIEKHHDH